ncbi:DUF547 domain-containing protein [Flavobacteriales bacterium]|nr:DUF547 domain-containing protein [Flavobacteriales bacterium]MDB4088327.1 DUF547 domain-containing protein [Flavobacteriales bacterium]
MKKIASIFLLTILFVSCGNGVEKNNNSITDRLIEDVDLNETSQESDSLVETKSKDDTEIKSNFDSTSISHENKILADADKVSEKEKNVVVKIDSKEEKVTTKIVTEIKKGNPITNTEGKTDPTPQIKAEIHKTWDDLLKKHVSSSGKVNYAGFVKDKDELLKYIKELQSFHKDVSSWGKNKRLAYWINVYNAVTVKLIADNYPVKSITDLNGGKPWNEKLIDLGGVSYSLDVIENKIIRPKYNEPRIHFAVNCAAKSCPKIMNKAWTEDNIQRYLTKQTKAFIANTTQNSISADKVVLSKIFSWYKVDFGGDDSKLVEFINKYSEVQVNENAIITYNDYNWNLNN